MNRHLKVAVMLAALLGLMAGACGDDDETAPLAAVCPDPVIIQTDWNPESEHGGLYQMVGPDPLVDTTVRKVSGALMDGDADTGVRIEIRIGGPAVGFDQVSAVMYRDPSILLGYVVTDEAVQNSASMPTQAVLAPLEINPQMIMWDPAAHPQVHTIADLGRTGTTVVYNGGATYMEYLVGASILQRSQIEGSYDGTPTRFVAAGGQIAQQGFASSEPYIYENEVAEWGKPVAFQLIHDTGYRVYAQALAARTGDIDMHRACFTRLVPIMQRAQVAFLQSPAKATALILDLIERYNTGWVYSQGVADFSVQQQRALGLAGNGADATLGNFDLQRVQEVIDILKPILARENVPIKPDLEPEDLVTNEFIDASIGLR